MIAREQSFRREPRNNNNISLIEIPIVSRAFQLM